MGVNLKKNNNNDYEKEFIVVLFNKLIFRTVINVIILCLCLGVGILTLLIIGVILKKNIPEKTYEVLVIILGIIIILLVYHIISVLLLARKKDTCDEDWEKKILDTYHKKKFLIVATKRLACVFLRNLICLICCIMSIGRVNLLVTILSFWTIIMIVIAVYQAINLIYALGKIKRYNETTNDFNKSIYARAILGLHRFLVIPLALVLQRFLVIPLALVLLRLLVYTYRPRTLKEVLKRRGYKLLGSLVLEAIFIILVKYEVIPNALNYPRYITLASYIFIMFILYQVINLILTLVNIKKYNKNNEDISCLELNIDLRWILTIEYVIKMAIIAVAVLTLCGHNIYAIKEKRRVCSEKVIAQVINEEKAKDNTYTYTYMYTIGDKQIETKVKYDYLVEELHTESQQIDLLYYNANNPGEFYTNLAMKRNIDLTRGIFIFGFILLIVEIISIIMTWLVPTITEKLETSKASLIPTDITSLHYQ